LGRSPRQASIKEFKIRIPVQSYSLESRHRGPSRRYKNVREVSEKILEISAVLRKHITLTDNLEQLEKGSLFFKGHCQKKSEN